VGARGLGGFRGLLLGSVSQHCLHHATSPIAIVRAKPDRVADGPDRTERVVTAVDGSPSSQRALAWAADEARLREATLEVINAWRVPSVGGYPVSMVPVEAGPFEEVARTVVEDAVAALDPQRLPARVEQRSVQGGAAPVILDVAKGADLVVMGSRGRGGFKAALLGSVANQVTHHAPCPVVVLRDSEHR
jgi:nucleotide-binding universal stress UspA family protein